MDRTESLPRSTVRNASGTQDSYGSSIEFDHAYPGPNAVEDD